MKLLIMFFLGSFLFIYAQNDINIQNQTIQNSNINTDMQQATQSKDNKNIPDLSFLSLYQHADIVVKCVIIILFAFSVITWGVFIAKLIDYNKAFKKIKNEQNVLNNIAHFNDISMDKKGYTQDIAKEVSDEIQYMENMQSLKERIRLRVENRITYFSATIKHGVAILASIGSSAPFIGLFGTVWGIMNSFIGIATSNNAQLSVVAPGIAEALFATAFGLIAAIPAVLFYNYFVRLGIKFTNQINQLATRIYILNERQLTNKKDSQ